MPQQTARTCTCALERGLYFVRYDSSGAGYEPPSANVRAAAGSEKHVTIVNAPGHTDGELPIPGATLVVQAEDLSTLEITVNSRDPRAAVDAKFKVELLCRSAREASSPGALAGRDGESGGHPANDTMSPEKLGFDFRAHVYRLGDVEIADGEWAAGPQAPTPIEGIELRPRVSDLSISGQFVNTIQRGRWSSWLEPGTFIGTRQKASPLTGLRLRLTGPGAARYSLSAEALFLGSPVMSRDGAEVELAGAGTMDPLVGLRVGLTKRPGQVRDQPIVAAPRVRVFRSSSAIGTRPSPDLEMRR